MLDHPLAALGRENQLCSAIRWVWPADNISRGLHIVNKFFHRRFRHTRFGGKFGERTAFIFDINKDGRVCGADLALRFDAKPISNLADEGRIDWPNQSSNGRRIRRRR